jgi:hypothetical protein
MRQAAKLRQQFEAGINTDATIRIRIRAEGDGQQPPPTKRQRTEEEGGAAAVDPFTDINARAPGRAGRCL